MYFNQFTEAKNYRNLFVEKPRMFSRNFWILFWILIHYLAQQSQEKNKPKQEEVRDDFLDGIIEGIAALGRERDRDVQQSHQHQQQQRILPSFSPEKWLRPPRLLVCAPSNAAVDEILVRIVQESFLDSSQKAYRPHILRVGHSPKYVLASDSF
jgi:hypothetical protein